MASTFASRAWKALNMPLIANNTAAIALSFSYTIAIHWTTARKFETIDKKERDIEALQEMTRRIDQATSNTNLLLVEILNALQETTR